MDGVLKLMGRKYRIPTFCEVNGWTPRNWKGCASDTVLDGRGGVCVCGGYWEDTVGAVEGRNGDGSIASYSSYFWFCDEMCSCIVAYPCIVALFAPCTLVLPTL